MKLFDLSEIESGASLDCDLVIVGGGPAGLAIAREFFAAPQRVLIIESGGFAESAETEALNKVENVEGWTEAQAQKRVEFHGANAKKWSHANQGFGVRCRVLGGSTQAWAGKSALFDDMDFEARPWAPRSGWPINRAALEPYFDRAAAFLNLGPNIYDEGLWRQIPGGAPKIRPDPKVLRSFFWQFARLRIDQFDLLRVGQEFAREQAENIQVLLNATVVQVLTDETGQAFDGVEIAGAAGKRVRIRAKAGILSASAIENARLLLASRAVHKNGLGNQHDLVGRFLMDHPGARIARFRVEDIPKVAGRFGFYGVPHDKGVSMYMHGLAPSRETQEQRQMLNCAVYMMEERAPDDPWDSMKRLLQRKSTSPLSDMKAVAGSPGLLAKGLGRRAFQSKLVPDFVKTFVTNQLIRFNPNFVVQEFQTGGLPHKLKGFVVDAITEQLPDSENRVTLSDSVDALGVPLARARWRVGEDSRRTLANLGRLLAEEFSRVGLPAPVLEDWVAEDRVGDAVIIDMAHTAGTTRMSDDPKTGVVDANCQVHGVAGLYVAGASVFPTSGHANPTLMIVTLAVRLADFLKRDFSRAV